jgi:hypothetical protein
MIYIYGCGSVGKDLYRALVKQGEHVIGFIDQAAKPGDAWCGIPIFLPTDPTLRKENEVVIGLFNKDTFEPDVVKSLQRLGFQKIRGFLSVYHQDLYDEIGERFWLSRYTPIPYDTRAKALELFKEEKSRDLFSKIIQFRDTLNHKVLPPIETCPQYFAPDLPPLKEPVRYIDCGACDGDTIRDLAKTGTRVEKVLAFEPDGKMWDRLIDMEFPFPVEKSCAILSGDLGRVTFDTSRGKILEGEGFPLDLADFEPTFIKMDIEGSEIDALWGAREMLKKHRPQLAISIYHRPAHLWQVPLLIDELCGPGEHYLRLYGHNGLDLVDHFYPA